MKLPKEYYPTPLDLAEKMAYKADIKIISNVLEPSAGDGNLIRAIARRIAANNYRYSKDLDFSAIDAIEINEDLQAILKSKEIRVVYDDFLTYHTYKRYDLIIMNPPFSNGDKHLLKALEMQKNGGQIVCLLNAETLKNPYTNVRADLVRRLDKHEASVEYIENAFVSSDRPTGVEVALVYVNIPNNYEDSDLLKNLEKALRIEEVQSEDTELTTVLDGFLYGAVRQYEAETAAGVKLIREYQAFSPKCARSLEDNYSNIIEMKLCHSDGERDLLNGYLNQVRYKYWEALLGRKEFLSKMTSKLRDNYYNKLQELKHYEFNLRNIMQLQVELEQNKVKGIEDTILDLFDEFACEHSWYPECTNNVHYYDGWSTNKCGYVHKKVIIPLNAFSGYDGRFSPRYNVGGKLSDIEKVLAYLDTGSKIDTGAIGRILDVNESNHTTKNIEFRYFFVTFYKKGTAHITFRNLELIKRLNIFAGRKRGGLPPSYGKKPYSDMSTSEKRVIDGFEGEQEYNNVYKHRDRYIIETESMLMLEVGDDCA